MIWDFLQQTRDRAAAWSQNYGVYSARSFFVCRRVPNQTTIFTEILPRPIIEDSSPRLIEIYATRGIQIELEDLIVSGISKAYSADDLLGRTIYYMIDAVVVDGVPVGGLTCDRVEGTELSEATLHWSLTLRRRK